jgi:hypothetical protein
MTDVTGFGRTAVGSGLARSEQARRVATLPHGMMNVELGETALTSLAAVLQKKHTFNCALPTHGGVCGC